MCCSLGRRRAVVVNNNDSAISSCDASWADDTEDEDELDPDSDGGRTASLFRGARTGGER